MKIQTLLAAAALSLSVASASQASIVINVEETGSDVTASFSGSFDVDGSDLLFTSSFDAAGIASGAGIVIFGNAAYDFYSFTPLTFGTDNSGVIGAHTGDNLFVWGQFGVIAFETGYAGEEISGSLTFGSQSFDDLGLTDGDSFVFAGATDTLEVNIGSAITTVPVPAGLLLLGTSLAGLGMVRRKG